jgi:hypothetical protein
VLDGEARSKWLVQNSYKEEFTRAMRAPCYFPVWSTATLIVNTLLAKPLRLC